MRNFSNKTKYNPKLPAHYWLVCLMVAVLMVIACACSPKLQTENAVSVELNEDSTVITESAQYDEATTNASVDVTENNVDTVIATETNDEYEEDWTQPPEDQEDVVLESDNNALDTLPSTDNSDDYLDHLEVASVGVDAMCYAIRPQETVDQSEPEVVHSNPANVQEYGEANVIEPDVTVENTDNNGANIGVDGGDINLGVNDVDIILGEDGGDIYLSEDIGINLSEDDGYILVGEDGGDIYLN